MEDQTKSLFKGLGYRGGTLSIITTMKKIGSVSSRPAQTAKLTKKQQLCVECRKCCQKVGVYTDPAIYEMAEADVIHFYEARGAAVAKSDDELFIVFDIPCPHLTVKGCSIYEKRPKICRYYSGLDEFGRECLWSSLSNKKSGKAKIK